jgi:nucleotide-binding universal stress UspA family protein
MSWKSLMVHLELKGDNAGVLSVAAELAARFDARVIGVAACQMQQVFYESYAGADVMGAEREEIAAELSAAEKQFRAALDGRVRHLEWRCTTTYAPLADFLADESRAADLIITGKDIGPHLFDDTRRVNIADLAMRAGRPVLLVPDGVRSLPMRHVFVGWKESREARRAVVDALPLLREAGHGTVLEIASGERLSSAQAHVADVASWLEEHGVTAVAQALEQVGGETGHLHAELLDRRCDLFVAGAYGHLRLREWAFGGVTEDILLDPDFCVLISH